MCTATLGALYPAYFEQKDLIGEVDASEVIAMYGQAVNSWSKMSVADVNAVD